IVLHVTFMEMNSTAARALGMQLGVNFSGRTFGFALGGNNSVLTGSSAAASSLTAAPGFSAGYNVATVPAGLTPGSQGYPLPVGSQFGTPNGSAFIPGATTTPINFIASNTATYQNFLGGPAVTGNLVGLGLGVLNVAPALIQQAVLFGSPGGA